jgi:hypothetical protein
VQRVDKTTQQHNRLVRFDIDLQRFQGFYLIDGGFNLGGDDRVMVIPGDAIAFLHTGAPEENRDYARTKDNLENVIKFHYDARSFLSARGMTLTDAGIGACSRRGHFFPLPETGNSKGSANFSGTGERNIFSFGNDILTQA